jgi:hypothetical protein
MGAFVWETRGAERRMRFARLLATASCGTARACRYIVIAAVAVCAFLDIYLKYPGYKISDAFDISVTAAAIQGVRFVEAVGLWAVGAYLFGRGYGLESAFIVDGTMSTLLFGLTVANLFVRTQDLQAVEDEVAEEQEYHDRGWTHMRHLPVGARVFALMYLMPGLVFLHCCRLQFVHDAWAEHASRVLSPPPPPAAPSRDEPGSSRSRLSYYDEASRSPFSATRTPSVRIQGSGSQSPYSSPTSPARVHTLDMEIMRGSLDQHVGGLEQYAEPLLTREGRSNSAPPGRPFGGDSLYSTL